MGNSKDNNIKELIWELKGQLPEVINMKLLPIYPYFIQKMGNENIQTYQFEVVILI